MACRLLHSVPGSLKLIQDSVVKVVDADNPHNTCLVPLIDSLRNRFIKTHKTEYLDCLDSICFNCSDDVGEKFGDTILFYQCFKPYIDYLYTHGDSGNCLTVSLIVGFGFDDIDDPTDLFEAKKRLDTFIEAEEKQFKLPDGEIKLLELIKHYAENPGVEDEE